MTRDNVRDALAYVAAQLDGDEEGQRVIRDNAGPGLIDGLAEMCAHSLRVMANQDRATLDEALDKLRACLRSI